MSVVIITNNKNEAFKLKYVYIIHKDQNNAYVFNVSGIHLGLIKRRISIVKKFTAPLFLGKL